MNTEWHPIDSAPTNIRILVYQDGEPPDDEMAIAWLDLIDRQLYYSPQGGVITWIPTHWRSLPDGPKVS